MTAGLQCDCSSSVILPLVVVSLPLVVVSLPLVQVVVGVRAEATRPEMDTRTKCCPGVGEDAGACRMLRHEEPRRECNRLVVVARTWLGCQSMGDGCAPYLVGVPEHGGWLCPVLGWDARAWGMVVARAWLGCQSMGDGCALYLVGMALQLRGDMRAAGTRTAMTTPGPHSCSAVCLPP